MTESASFPVTDRNRVKRLPVRGTYDKAAIHAVLDASMLCHIAYVIDGQPYCTPTIFWRDDEVLYWHGSSADRMLRHLGAGLPTCLTVSHLDGLVLARTGFHHSANYRSVMCFGTARKIEDPDDKARALAGMINRLYPGRDGDLRPATRQEIKATTVIAMPIDEASAKTRAAGVADDEDDYALPVWAGVIPVRTVIGADQPCPRLLPGMPRPHGLDIYRDGASLDDALTVAQRRYERNGQGRDPA